MDTTWRPKGEILRRRREVSEVWLRLRNEYAKIQIADSELPDVRERGEARQTSSVEGPW